MDWFRSADASSILCAGVTTYVPLKRYGVGPKSKVAVLSLGGLGHFGVQWANAMGAEVVAFGAAPDKLIDAKSLVCDDYILVQNPKDAEPHMNIFTHILATKVLNENWDMYFPMLKKNDTFILCDIPEAPLYDINVYQMTSSKSL